jgi:ribosomal protein S21
MGVRLRLGDREPIAQALKRFRRLVELHRSFEKWYKLAQWRGRYLKPSEIRDWKKRARKARLQGRAIRRRR